MVTSLWYFQDGNVRIRRYSWFQTWRWQDNSMTSSYFQTTLTKNTISPGEKLLQLYRTQDVLNVFWTPYVCSFYVRAYGVIIFILRFIWFLINWGNQLRQSSIYKYRFYLPRFEIVQKSWNRHCNSCLKFTLSLKKNSRSFHDLNITIGKTNHYSFQVNNAAFILSHSS